MGSRVCWLLVGAVSLGAALAGHAVQGWIESAHLFGSAPALYNHSLQAPFAYLVVAALILAASLVVCTIFRRLRSGSEDADWLVPALGAASRIAPNRLIALVIAAQFAFLIIGELGEQSLSSYDSVGFGAIFGPGHLTAPFVYAVIGVVAAWLLIAFARAVRAGAADFAQFVGSVIALLRPPSSTSGAPKLRVIALQIQSLAPPLLAQHIASRPPPAASVLVA